MDVAFNEVNLSNDTKTAPSKQGCFKISKISINPINRGSKL